MEDTAASEGQGQDFPVVFSGLRRWGAGPWFERWLAVGGHSRAWLRVAMAATQRNNVMQDAAEQIGVRGRDADGVAGLVSQTTAAIIPGHDLRPI